MLTKIASPLALTGTSARAGRSTGQARGRARPDAPPPIRTADGEQSTASAAVSKSDGAWHPEPVRSFQRPSRGRHTSRLRHAAGSVGGAAIPEAVLGVILLIAAVTVLASARRAWAIGIATTTVAIFVVLYGISITVRGGQIGDIGYHAMLLLILMIAGVALLRLAGTSSS